MEKNLKHGLKCGKRDVVLETRYFVNIPLRSSSHIFLTKLSAINFISNCLSDGIPSDDIKFLKVQSLKFLSYESI